MTLVYPGFSRNLISFGFSPHGFKVSAISQGCQTRLNSNESPHRPGTRSPLSTCCASVYILPDIVITLASSFSVFEEEHRLNIRPSNSHYSMAEHSDLDEHRSASLGSLHHTFRAHDLTPNVYNSLPTPRRPLRPINDNVHLLRSPGPLESMLKTTTETGDIGLFTIRPSIPPATYHPAPRSRPGICDAQLLHASRSKLLQNEPIRNDRQRLPSHYRDTTSEILSLYGSDSQPSYSRSLSSSHDDGWRSYSLNTSNSRHISHQKSSATLPHQSSLASLQRPRSPFPYPTRLKRSGIRPASPALMENGCVDYTKMVELDRVSYVCSRQIDLTLAALLI